MAARRTLIAIIRIIVSSVMDVETHTAKQQKCDHVYIQTPYKGILSNDKPAICRMWSSAQCQAPSGTPRRNASLAFRLERLQKFRYGVPPFHKVPVLRSGAFRLSLSTVNRCFLNKTKDILVPLYKSLVCSRLEYCVQTFI